MLKKQRCDVSETDPSGNTDYRNRSGRREFYNL